jgi:hypothetical protein
MLIVDVNSQYKIESKWLNEYRLPNYFSVLTIDIRWILMIVELISTPHVQSVHL